MITIPPLRTRRRTVQLKELSIGDQIALATIPEARHERAVSAFLRASVGEDGMDWTVQERVLAVTHYMSASLETGPNFIVADLGDGVEARYADYLDAGADYPDPATFAPLGELEGDTWTGAHLLGRDAEAIERLAPEFAGIPGSTVWLIGAMAATLHPEHEPAPSVDMAAGDYENWLRIRMRTLFAYPGSRFESLLAFHAANQARVYHLFAINRDDAGIVVMPKEVGTYPPARFLVDSCLSSLAQKLSGRA